MKKACMFIALAVSFVFGQTVSLSGTVTNAVNSALPVAGAKVYLSNNPYITCLTDAQGGFSLTGTGIIRSRQGAVPAQSSMTVTFNKNRITVVSADKQSMKVELFNCKGERVGARDFNLAAGRNEVVMGGDLLARGMYMARASIGNKWYTSTFMSMESGKWATTKTKSSMRGIAKQKDNGMDSLVVSAKGYLLAKAGLSGYTAQNITVAVQPFIPSGMKLIPAKDSSFMMGSALNSPIHSVAFTHNYYMDSTEVTQADFNSNMQNCYATFTSMNWGLYGKSDNEAAYYIDWNDAVLYCNARSKRDSLDTIYSYVEMIGNPGAYPSLIEVNIDYQKNGYGLPTEAEWEYACRAGTKTDWYFDTAQAGNYAWYIANSQSKIYPGATKLPNGFGLYDMSGNVWEWANDWYDDYPDSSQTDPVGPDSGTEKIWRGGSWGSYLYVISSVYRGHSDPADAESDNGFRCILRE